MIRILLSTRLGERRWTQADLARKTGIRASTINELYNEFAKSVSLETLDKICEALGCELSDLIIREEVPGERVYYPAAEPKENRARRAARYARRKS